MEYRKDLDGLRAISIIFVVFYHLQLNLFNGLFLGGFPKLLGPSFHLFELPVQFLEQS